MPGNQRSSSWLPDTGTPTRAADHQLRRGKESGMAPWATGLMCRDGANSGLDVDDGDGVCDGVVYPIAAAGAVPLLLGLYQLFTARRDRPRGVAAFGPYGGLIAQSAITAAARRTDRW